MRGREPLAVWLLFGVVTLEILVTYARVPAEELYHVTGSGLAGGISRVVVFLNFPAALVAIAIVAVSYPCLTGRGRAVATVALWLWWVSRPRSPAAGRTRLPSRARS